ncbi:MAG: 16S rRNA (adenine(1518)-N(6)/adenine(1519)-N(6))-dimethyltransferase RsmA [Rhodospirillales bacterium]
MPDTHDLPPLRAVIARHGLSARRALGQNFLLDLNLTRRIARAAAPLDGRLVVEVGPGPGGLTRALLESPARHVVAIERDPRCVAALGELVDAFPGRLAVIEADALEIDVAALAAAHGGGPVAIVANLPFNVATPLLIAWLRRLEAIEALTLMFQKEVADRLIAAPRSGDYGRLSVIVQWLCTARRLFDVPAQAFTPPPKVAATVVRLEPRPAPLAPARFADLERITQAAFGQRRKMLRAALRSLGGDAEALLAAAGVTPTARAEELPVEAFCALARAWAASRDGHAAIPAALPREEPSR